MKVNPQNNKQGQVQQAESSRAERTSGARKSSVQSSGSKRGSSASEASLSEKAKEMATARNVAQSTPDVRDERIAELKKRIANGEYKVDADGVADRMIREHLQQS